MDFHSLSRRELQALCKKNKIPANITNLAMADALSALDNVEGLEDLLNTEQPSVDSPMKTEMIKRSVSRTSCRPSTRRKPISEVPQGSTQILTRTRGGARRPPVGEEENADAPVDMVRRKMDTQLKEAAEDENKMAATPAAVVAASRRRAGTSVKQACSTRRSTRLLEKQMMGMNLDDDDDEVVGDAKTEYELRLSDEWVVVDKVLDVEAVISQDKKPSELEENTDVSDEKPATLLEESLMGDNNEVDSFDVELKKSSEALDEHEDHLHHADVFIQSKDVDASLKKLEEDCEKTVLSVEEPAALLEDSLMGDNIEVDSSDIEPQRMSEALDEHADHMDHAEVFIESEDVDASLTNEAKDAIVTFAIEEKLKGEDSTPLKLEDKETFASDKIVAHSIITDEIVPEKSMEMAVMTQIAEGRSICETDSDGKTELSVFVSEVKDETRSTHRDQIANHAEVKEKIETHNFPGVNKENFMKEKIEKVKIVNTDTSLRQLKKMLKNLNI